MYPFLDPMLDNKSTFEINRLFPMARALANSCIRNTWTQSNGSVYLRITQGLRTIREQDELYAQGRTKPGKIVTKAQGGSSWHNYGLAFDVAIINPDATLHWDTTSSAWLLYQEVGLALGLTQTTINKWIDTPHFEYHPHTTLKQVKVMLIQEAKGDITKFYNIYSNFIQHMP